MLNLHQNIRNSIVFELKENGNWEKYQGYDAFDCLYSRCYIENNGMHAKGVQGLFAKYGVGEASDIYSSEYFVQCLDHYFRMLYRIIKYVDESNLLTKEQKYNYICIVRATLSLNELLVLFYNCLSKNGNKKFKPLIERYALFNNLRTEELATDEERKLYASKFEDTYPFNLDDDKDNPLEYKKGAFVYRK